MQLSPELLAAIGTAILVLLAVIALRLRRGKTPTHQTPVSRGPSNLRYICRGCSDQFTHSKRTIGAYEKGARGFFCNSCHSKWRESNPARPADQQTIAKVGPSAGNANVGRSIPNSGQRGSFNQSIGQSPVKSGSGCLGATLFIVAVPIALLTIAAKYA